MPTDPEFDSISAAWQLVDRALWVVTAATAKRRGGLLASFVMRSSIDPHVPQVLIGLAPNHFTCELVDGARDLGGGVSVLPAPGETPGHQIVRLRAGGQSLFCLGDLYHHPLEVERPEWLVNWADPAATRASRAALLPEILAGDALVLATHIAGFGRLRQAGARLRWVPA